MIRFARLDYQRTPKMISALLDYINSFFFLFDEIESDSNIKAVYVL